MATINVGRENSAAIDLYYEDQGSGPVVVLLSGWPFDGRSWEPQVHALLAAGYRVVNYDRRGFGRSSRPSVGYDFDTLAADLDAVLTALDVRDVTVIGFSLGTGELARYVGRYGTERLRGAVFIESLAPSFVKSPDNPAGVDEAGVAGVQQAILDDRYAWLTGMMNEFLNLDEYLGKRVSEDTVRAMWAAGAEASPYATWACPVGWLDDFTTDIEKIDVPTLILHGTADRILSIDGQGRRLHAALPAARYVEIDGGPHIHCVTHAAEVNRELLAFLGDPAGTSGSGWRGSARCSTASRSTRCQPGGGPSSPGSAAPGRRCSCCTATRRRISCGTARPAARRPVHGHRRGSARVRGLLPAGPDTRPRRALQAGDRGRPRRGDVRARPRPLRRRRPRPWWPRGLPDGARPSRSGDRRRGVRRRAHW